MLLYTKQTELLKELAGQWRPQMTFASVIFKKHTKVYFLSNSKEREGYRGGSSSYSLGCLCSPWYFDFVEDCFSGAVGNVVLLAQMVKILPAMQVTWVWSLGREDPLEKEMATHFGILAWRIPWTEEPGGLQYMGSQRVWHGWASKIFIFTSLLQFWGHADHFSLLHWGFLQCSNAYSWFIEMKHWPITRFIVEFLF